MPFVRRGISGVLTLVFIVAGGNSGAAQTSAAPAPIKDNSFLVEEAYNQEAGVVQHITTFAGPLSGRGWAFSFTQEWPVTGMKHQFSYTLPVISAVNTGVGDVPLIYRYQLAGAEGGSMAVAPRLAAIVPSGDATRGMGTGAFGLQANLPVSAEFSPSFTMHTNAGVTITPGAEDAFGNRATTRSFAAGGSIIWLASPTFNVMFESVWTSTDAVAGADITSRTSSFVIAPGIRRAFNLSGGTQVVPGLAFVKGLGDNRSQEDLFFYLSIEHPFRR